MTLRFFLTRERGGGRKAIAGIWLARLLSEEGFLSWESEGGMEALGGKGAL